MIEGELRMLANWLLIEYEQYGYVDEKGDLFIPIEMINEFMNDCDQYQITMAAIDFISPSEDALYYQVQNLDCSEIVWSFSDWDHLVNYCNHVILRELEEEENIEYFIPYLLEEHEWRMKRMTEDIIPILHDEMEEAGEKVKEKV